MGYRVTEIVEEGYLQVSPEDALKLVLENRDLLKQLKAKLAELPDVPPGEEEAE